MEKFPEIADKTATSHRLPLEMPTPSYLQDHRFMGKAVYPAVEAMQTLANTAASIYPHIDVAWMTSIRFDKFLPIPSKKRTISVLAEVVAQGPTRLTLALMSRKRIKTSTMSRLLTHATVCFQTKNSDGFNISREMTTSPADTQHVISASRIYEELILFGPAYQNLTDDLILSPTGAVAKIKAPNIEPQGPLGSPFSLDAAFHAACAWGQHYAGFVPFPVKIGDRRVITPTVPGEDYVARIIPGQATPDRLDVDIWLYDNKGRLRETASGVEMRDVSNGQLRPPDWIRQNGEASTLSES